MIKRDRAEKYNVPESIEKEKNRKKRPIQVDGNRSHIKTSKSWPQGKLRETFQRAYD